MKSEGKLFPALKIVTLNSNMSMSAPLCTCDFKPICSCDIKMRFPLKSCDCDPRCSCDSLGLKPPCTCDYKLPCMSHCACDSRRGACLSDITVPLRSSLPRGCETDAVSSCDLVRIMSTTISETGTSTEVYYRKKGTAELVKPREC